MKNTEWKEQKVRELLEEIENIVGTEPESEPHAYFKLGQILAKVQATRAALDC